MADILSIDIGDNEVALTVKHIDPVQNPPSSSSNANKNDSGCFFSVPFTQKLIAEVVGTYLLIFVGCASVLVNENYDKVVTLPGIAMVWGLTVMILVYSLGHISGAHFNPAVSIAFATCNRFSWKHMAESSSNGNHGISLTVKDDSIQNSPCPPCPSPCKPKPETPAITFSVLFMQKIMAEVVGTYFLIFAGCASVVVNTEFHKVVTLPGISIVWGLAVMVLVYSVGHISGAHFNPSVTIAFATCKRFPWKQVPAYIVAQVLGSTLAAGTLRLLFDGKQKVFFGTIPAGSNMQSFVLEFIITFYLMFVISGVATDNRAIGELAGLAVGSTVLLNVMFAGPISGASMNPARSLGPAIVSSQYKGLWIYMFAPILGAVCGALVYNMVRYTDKPLREITKSASFLKATSRA